MEEEVVNLEDVKQAFTNGVVFYCGLCRSAYPPFQGYPIIYTLPEDPSAEDWITASDFLLSYSVETILIYSRNPDRSALQYLIEKGISLFGIHEPAQGLEIGWASTIRFVPETLIQKHWEDLSAGISGWIDVIPIQFMNINNNIFSLGRQRLVNETLTDLMDGFIETGSHLE